MYLFDGGDGQKLDESINHHLAHSEVWQKVVSRNTNTVTSTGSNIVDTGNIRH